MSFVTWVDLLRAAEIDSRSLSAMEVYRVSGRILNDAVIHIMKATEVAGGRVSTLSTGATARLAAKYCARFGKPSPDSSDYALLSRLTIEMATHLGILAEGKTGIHWQHLAKHLATVNDVGGYLALNTAIAYRAWVLKWHTKEIAAELNMEPLAVRELLQKMLSSAEELGFETFPRRFRVDTAQVIRLWDEGLLVGQIAAQLGCDKQAVRTALKHYGKHTRRTKCRQ